MSPVSAKTVNGCVIKAKTKCVKADLKGANFKKVNLLVVNLRGADLTGVKWSNTASPDGTVTNTGC